MTFWALSPSLFHSLQTSSPTALSATLPLSPASKPGPHFCAIFLRHAFHFSFHNNSSSPQNCYFALVLFIVVRCFFFLNSSSSIFPRILAAILCRVIFINFAFYSSASDDSLGWFTLLYFLFCFVLFYALFTYIWIFTELLIFMNDLF